MIGSAIQDRNRVKVYNTQGRYLFDKLGVLHGYTSSVVSIRDGNKIYNYDSNGHFIKDIFSPLPKEEASRQDQPKQEQPKQEAPRQEQPSYSAPPRPMTLEEFKVFLKLFFGCLIFCLFFYLTNNLILAVLIPLGIVILFKLFVKKGLNQKVFTIFLKLFLSCLFLCPFVLLFFYLTNNLILAVIIPLGLVILFIISDKLGLNQEVFTIGGSSKPQNNTSHNQNNENINQNQSETLGNTNEQE